MSSAFQHRVRNRQPRRRVDRRWARRRPAGSAPSAARPGWCPGPARPTAAPACTGAAARCRSASRRPCSTILPRYITATRSQKCRTTPRSWAMKTNAMPRSRAQVLQQVHHLGLDGHVERGHRLVGDDDLRAPRRAPGRCRCAGAGRRRTRAGSGCGAPGSGRPAPAVPGPASSSWPFGTRSCTRSGVLMMVPTVCRGFSECTGPGRSIWISRRNGRSSRSFSVRDVGALEQDLARGRLQQPGDQPAGGRLAAAGLADQAERLAGLQVEVDPVDGLHRPSCVRPRPAAP